MKKFKLLLIIICFSFVFPSIAIAEDSFPSFPMAFYGEANLNGSPLPAGSKIQAYSGATLLGEISLPNVGVYGYDDPIKTKLVVGNFSGDVVFKYMLAGSTSQAGCSVQEYNGSFISGSSILKNLSFSTNCNSVNSGGGGGGGGGGSAINYCTSVSYSDWNNYCSGDSQVRSVISSLPSGCTLTSTQQIAVQRTCQKSSISTTTPISTTTILVITPIASSSPASTFSSLLETIASEAQVLNSDDNKKFNEEINKSLEQSTLIKYKTILESDRKITDKEKNVVNNFLVYGTPSTLHLGAGERAGTVNSYLQAYNKLPNSEDEWSDIIKIANGRWPSEKSSKSESIAKNEFKKIYGRDANMKNNIDENAVMVISYGLLPSQRNLNSEKAAIKAFKWVYNRVPVSALDWNIVRSIAYSGAKR